MLANRSGNSGRYLSVLNCASEYGLSFEQCGREWLLVTSRSASSSATGLGSHRGSAISMNRQLVSRDVLLVDGIGEQALGQLGRFTPGQQPARHVAGEDIDDDVQVEIGPLDRPENRGMAGLAASLTHFARGSQ